MTALRRLLAQRHLAVLILAAALAMKLLIPGGYMLSVEHGRMAITLCPGTVPVPKPNPMPMAGMHGDGAGHHDDKPMHAQAEMPCAFAGLSHQALGAIDPILIAGLIAFIMALGAAPSPPLSVAQARRLRPPLRGPPLLPLT